MNAISRRSGMSRRIRHVLDRTADRSAVSGGLKVGIVAACVLGALVAPGIGTQTQDTAKLKTEGMMHAKALALGLIMYIDDYDGITPYADETSIVKEVTQPYVKAPIPGASPAENRKAVWQTMNPAVSEFLYNISFGGIRLSDLENPANTPVIYESKPWAGLHSGRIVAFADGHVRMVVEQDWKTRFRPYLHLKTPKTAKKVLRLDPPAKTDPNAPGYAGYKPPPYPGQGK